jgi:hypothetical protein
MGGWTPMTENGHELSLASSALQKVIRRGDELNALYWAIEMSASVFNGWGSATGVRHIG